MAAVLRFLFLSSVIAVSLAQDDAVEGTLVIDDACLSGEDCGLSLRQLRLETGRQAREALSNSAVAEMQVASSMQAAMGHHMASTLDAVSLWALESDASLFPAREVWAVKQCYPFGNSSFMMECEDGVYKQTFYGSHGCKDSEVKLTEGGKSPWQYNGPYQGICHQDHEVCAKASGAPDSTSCVEVDADKHTGVYALDRCYPLDDKEMLSWRFACAEEVFTVTLYTSTGCTSSDKDVKLGGPSPWTYPVATLTCSEDATVCAQAIDATDATSCVDQAETPMCDGC